jgi:Zn-finger nucleic acid-binding protein
LNVNAAGRRFVILRKRQDAVFTFLRDAMLPVCPKCDESLFILNFKDVEVDFCNRCRGVWLDAGELESLMTSTGAAAEDPLLNFLRQEGTLPPDGKSYLCPRCDKPMQQIKVGDAGELLLERCASDEGLWFDAGELRRLLAMFPPSAGAGRTIALLNEIFGAMPKQQT